MSRFSSAASVGGPFRPQPATEVLHRAEAFLALRVGLEQVTALEHDLAQLLPDYLVTSVQPSFIKDGILTLFTPHSALAARLRHLEPRIIADLQQRGWNVHAFTIRVKPRLIETHVSIKQTQMTTKGVKALRALSKALPPSPLQAALAKMAARHGNLCNETD